MIGMMHEVIGDLYHAKETNEINTILWSETVTIHRTFLNLLHEVAVEKFEIARILEMMTMYLLINDIQTNNIQSKVIRSKGKYPPQKWPHGNSRIYIFSSFHLLYSSYTYLWFVLI